MTEKPVVLFDFDGVIIRGDSFASFLIRRQIVGLRRVIALAALPFLALRWLIRSHRPRVLRTFMHIGTARMHESEVTDRAASFAHELVNEPGRIMPEAVTRVHEHLDRGDRVVVVTAAGDILARPILEKVGLGKVHLVASRRVAGTNKWVHNHGDQKIIELAEHGFHPPFDVVYSDSLSDLPMLRHALRPILINPKKSTGRQAREVLGDLVETLHWRQ